jgi:hypothetical protein
MFRPDGRQDREWLSDRGPDAAAPVRVDILVGRLKYFPAIAAAIAVIGHVGNPLFGNDDRFDHVGSLVVNFPAACSGIVATVISVVTIGEQLIETGRLKLAGRAVAASTGSISGSTGAGGGRKKRQCGQGRESEKWQECFHFRQV